MIVKIFLIVLFIRTSYQLNNGLGRTPQMGIDSSVIIVYKDKLFFLQDGTAGMLTNVNPMKQLFN